MYDADDTLLAFHAFVAANDGPYGPPLSAPFNLLVPLPAGVASLAIRDREGQRRWLATVSAQPPVVTWDTPGGGEFGPEDAIPISWSASDPDDDPLSYGLDFSRDGGRSWITIEPHITTTHTTWTPGMLATAPDARLRVRVSDGFHGAEAILPRR